MSTTPQPFMDAPTSFRIRVRGCPSQSWLEGMLGADSVRIETSDQGAGTTITGEVIDQASLMGFINALYNMGHAILSVEQLLPDDLGDQP